MGCRGPESRPRLLAGCRLDWKGGDRREKMDAILETTIQRDAVNGCAHTPEGLRVWRTTPAEAVAA